MNEVKEFCPVCGSPAIRFTRGIPSYAFCEKGHQWDRSTFYQVINACDNPRLGYGVLEQKYKELKTEKEQLEKDNAVLSQALKDANDVKKSVIAENENLKNMYSELENKLQEVREALKVIKSYHEKLNSKASTNNLYQVYELIDEMGLEIRRELPQAEEEHPLKKLAESQELADPEASKILNDNFGDLTEQAEEG